METVTSFLSQNWQWILGTVAALIAGGVVLKWRSNRQSGSSSYTDQSNATAGRDMIGRDQVTHRKD